ncbi:MAG TPA: peptide-methionine (R)-S-oxide reductase MsrB [Kangiella sp.]
MISILGAGAIGQLLAHKLTDASVECQLIVSDSDKYDSPDWQFRDINQKVSTKQLQSSGHGSNQQDSSPLDLVFVCVKAPQLQSALDSIRHRLHEKSQLALFQNGMGHDQIASRYVTEQNIFFASNTHGAYRESNQSLVYAGTGKIVLGALEQQAIPDWFNQLTQADTALAFEWIDNIQPVLWRKLLINAVINPLTAIHRCKNGDLLKKEHKTQLLALINESRQFAQSMGFDFADDLKTIILDVIEQTADNYSSMYQDVMAGQITEIDAINGYLLDQIQAKTFHAPHHWALWSQFHIQYPPLKKQAETKAKNFDGLTYHVTQQQGTERPFTGQYNMHQANGIYRCVCCHSVLFDASGKFDSGCGWPSFDRAQNNKAIAYLTDTSHNMQRVEIRCAQCGSHLGHVFDDGPTDTGQRYCVNSVSLDFEPVDR